MELVGWYVARKTVRTVKGEMMHFGCWMDAESNLFDTVHFPSFPEILQFKGARFYQLSGLVIEEFGQSILELRRMSYLKYLKRE